MAERKGAEVVLVRHGATEWSTAGRHTGRTDVPLTDAGREQARTLGRVLADRTFVRVFTSPLRRAAETCTLAGFASPEVLDDLQEWDYGEFEGITTAAIRDTHPGWTVWSGPVPGGETAEQIGARADRAIERLQAVGGDVAVFAHAHLLRVLAARWLGLDPRAGRYFVLDTATVSVLGMEREQRAIRAWNVGC
jgi:probable phosphoglycerate mutase